MFTSGGRLMPKAYLWRKPLTFRHGHVNNTYVCPAAQASCLPLLSRQFQGSQSEAAGLSHPAQLLAQWSKRWRRQQVAAPRLGRADARTYGLAAAPAPAGREKASSMPRQFRSHVLWLRFLRGSCVLTCHPHFIIFQNITSSFKAQNGTTLSPWRAEQSAQFWRPLTTQILDSLCSLQVQTWKDEKWCRSVLATVGPLVICIGSHVKHQCLPLLSLGKMRRFALLLPSMARYWHVWCFLNITIVFMAVLARSSVVLICNMSTAGPWKCCRIKPVGGAKKVDVNCWCLVGRESRILSTNSFPHGLLLNGLYKQ